MNGLNHATNPAVLVVPKERARFWSMNVLFWFAYGAALMVPWIGRYSVLDMLPNKTVIALTGVGVSAALWSFYRWLDGRGTAPVLFVASAVLACVCGAVVFDAAVIALTQGPEAVLPRWGAGGSFGALPGGVPMPGRIGQYSILLIAWSLGAHLFTRRPASRGVNNAQAESPSTVSPVDGTLSVSGTNVRARDGNRTVILERNEIDWIAADGDYIRIHTGGRSLLVRATMKNSAAVLAPLDFVRVHRSAIVNPKHVREIVREGSSDPVVVLRSGARIRTGRNYTAQVNALLE